VKANQKTLCRQIRRQFQGKRKIPFVAMDHEIGHGRVITWTLRAKQAPEHIREAWIGTSWIVQVTATGWNDVKPFHATHLFITNLRTTPKALLQLVRDRWRIEGWHWIRDTQLPQTTYATDTNGEIQALRQLLEAVELEGVLVQADALHANRPFSSTSPSAAPTS